MMEGYRQLPHAHGQKGFAFLSGGKEFESGIQTLSFIYAVLKTLVRRLEKAIIQQEGPHIHLRFSACLNAGIGRRASQKWAWEPRFGAKRGSGAA